MISYNHIDFGSAILPGPKTILIIQLRDVENSGTHHDFPDAKRDGDTRTVALPGKSVVVL